MAELLAEYVKEQNALCALARRYEGNNASLEQLSRNPMDDPMLQTAVDALAVFVDKQKNEYISQAKRTSDLAERVDRMRKECLAQLSDLVKTVQEIQSITAASSIEEETRVVVQAANALYMKTDNHDLRAEPPIGGTKKDRYRGTIGAQPEGTVVQSDDYECYDFAANRTEASPSPVNTPENKPQNSDEGYLS